MKTRKRGIDKQPGADRGKEIKHEGKGSKQELNAGNKQYSIVAWKLVDSAAYKNLTALGYEETVFRIRIPATEVTMAERAL